VSGYTRGFVSRVHCVNFLLRLAACAAACLALVAPQVSSAQASAKATPLFVLNSLDADVSVIDTQTWKELRRIPTGKQPHHLYLTPDEKSLIVANALSDSLSFFDPRTAELQRTVRGILDPYQLRFSPDMKWFVTAGNRLNHVDIYHWDGSNISLAKRVPTGKTPSHLWIDTKSTVVYSTMQDTDELVAIDLATQTLRWRVKTGSTPADIYGLPDDKTLLVALTGGNGFQVFDVSGPQARLVKEVKTGNGAHSFRTAFDRRYVYLSNREADTISKIDLQTLTVADTLPAPGGPDDMEVSSDGKFLYAASRWAKKLTVIDLEQKKVVKQVNVGKSPHGVWTLDHAPR